jgi:hypothetical protein
LYELERTAVVLEGLSLDAGCSTQVVAAASTHDLSGAFAYRQVMHPVFTLCPNFFFRVNSVDGSSVGCGCIAYGFKPSGRADKSHKWSQLVDDG